MAEQQAIQKATGPLGTIKKFIADPETQRRLADMLGAQAGTFANSIINVVSGNNKLQKCDPKTVMRSAMIAASVKLPIDPALGFAAIVPYGAEAQFQLMYKGVIQLCIRSGQYETIYDTEVYRDELESYNPITGEVKFKDLTEYKLRPQRDIQDVVGFYCHFQLLKGFHAGLYMTKEEVMGHAERYSKAFQYDLRANKKASPWSTDPIAMGRKTVILGLLKRYGIMSVEMQDAIIADTEGDDATTKHVESEQTDATNGRETFSLSSGAQTPARQPDEQTQEQPQQEQPIAGEEVKPCYYCKKLVAKRYRHVGHLACRDCVAKDAAAGAAPTDVGTDQEQQADAKEDGVTEGTDARPAASGVDPDAAVECENKHTFPYKVLVQGELGKVCPECGAEEWKVLGAEPAPEPGPNDFIQCKYGHRFYRSSVIPSPLAVGDQIGLCPVCRAEDDAATLV